MTYCLVSIGSQFESYNEFDLALAIDPSASWNIVSIDSEEKLCQPSQDPRLVRVCDAFESLDMMSSLVLKYDRIYFYDLVSCSGIFTPILELIQLINSEDSYVKMYYRHGNTLYSEHPEEFALVDKDVVASYPEFQEKPNLGRAIVQLFQANQEAAVAHNRPTSYLFMQEIRHIKKRVKQPFEVERFIRYLADVELIHIAATFVQVNNGALTPYQVDDIYNRVYCVVYTKR